MKDAIQRFHRLVDADVDDLQSFATLYSIETTLDDSPTPKTLGERLEEFTKKFLDCSHHSDIAQKMKILKLLEGCDVTEWKRNYGKETMVVMSEGKDNEYDFESTLKESSRFLEQKMVHIDEDVERTIKLASECEELFRNFQKETFTRVSQNNHQNNMRDNVDCREIDDKMRNEITLLSNRQSSEKARFPEKKMSHIDKETEKTLKLASECGELFRESANEMPTPVLQNNNEKNIHDTVGWKEIGDKMRYEMMLLSSAQYSEDRLVDGNESISLNHHGNGMIVASPFIENWNLSEGYWLGKQRNNMNAYQPKRHRNEEVVKSLGVQESFQKRLNDAQKECNSITERLDKILQRFEIPNKH